MIKIIIILAISLLAGIGFKQDFGSMASSFCQSRVGPGTLSFQWLQPDSVSERFVSSSVLGGMKPSEDGFSLKALTKADNSIEVDYVSRTYRLPFGFMGECQAVDASVRIGYPLVEVLYAEELRENQCLFEEIRNHEMVHVGLYLNNAQEAQTRVNDALGWVSRPAIYLTKQGAGTEIKSKMEAEVRPRLEEVFEKIEARQMAFDSPEEYQRLSSSCK